MATYKFKVTVPAPDEVTAGLDVNVDPGLVRARDAARAARTDEAGVRQRLADLADQIAGLKVAVPAGRARVADLEATLNSQQTIALTVASHQQRIVDADAAVVEATTRARASIVAEAGRRRDELQAVADELTPLLSALCAAESALDNVVYPLGERGGVKPLAWPETNEQAGALRSARIVIGAVRG